MAEKLDLKIGQLAYFRSSRLKKVISGKIVKLNPTRAKVDIDGSIWQVPYSMISTGMDQKEVNGEKYTYKKSGITSNKQLYELLSDVREEYEHIFNEVFDYYQHMKKERVTIYFGNKITYRKAGHYRHSDNSIMITKSYKNAPIKAIKFVIYHELLHIRWKHAKAHCPEFRKYEKMHEDYKFAKDFMSNLFRSIRIHGSDAFNFPAPKPEPISKSKPEIKPKVKVEKAIPKVLDKIDDRWKKIQEKKNTLKKSVKLPIKENKNSNMDERWKKIQEKKKKLNLLI